MEYHSNYNNFDTKRSDVDTKLSDMDKVTKYMEMENTCRWYNTLTQAGKFDCAHAMIKFIKEFK